MPLHNTIGFAPGDFVQFALAALLVCLLLGWKRAEPALHKLAARPRWCMLLCALLPVITRLALLPRFPVPVPATADDFSYLLLGDTLAHFRFANPVHPMHRFFESVFVLQQPSYSSIYPPGQGFALALGRAIFGTPWAGVVGSVAVFCALSYWMLRAWVSPGWALVGGLLAVIEFGPLNQWMNIYWGGAVSAVAGCLVFGALPRLRSRCRLREGALLGLGFALELLTRPFEFGLMLVACGLFLIGANSSPRKAMARPAALAALFVFAAAGIMFVQNRQVTGNWLTMPYQLSRQQYGVPATFTFQNNPVPHRELTAEQRLDYEAQCAIHGGGTDSVFAYFERLAGRLRYYRFFFLPPLLLALPAFFLLLRRFPYLWVTATVALFALGTNFYPYFYPHYIAAETGLFLLASVASLERIGPLPARIILLVCAAHFLFWYGVQAAQIPADPEARAAINQRLAGAPGMHLVFVRYAPTHMFHEWIHNEADIDRARVVWAADLGDRENLKLRQYYPRRAVWLAEPDAKPVKLTPYPSPLQ